MKDLRFRRQVDDCRPYIAGESEASVLRRYGLEKVVKLGSNENPFAPYPHELEAMKESLRHLNRYPEDDYIGLTETIAEKNGVKRENVALGSGAGNVIETVSRLFLDEGDEVLIARPTYRLYREVSKLMGAKVIEVPVRADFTYDLAAMKDAVTERTKMIWLCNPNNPTGAVNDPGEIEAFIDEVGDRVWVAVDEAYADFIDDGRRPDLVSRINDRKIVIIRTFSKFYGLAGARVGCVIAASDVIGRYDTITEPFCVNRTGLFAANAALTKDGSVCREVRDTIALERHLIENELLALQMKFVPSQSNFIFTRLPGGLSADDVCEEMMSRGVIIRSCSSWGYDDFVRITVGLPRENAEMLRVLGAVLEECGVRPQENE